MKTLQEIKKFAIAREACAAQYCKFAVFVEEGDNLKAWQTVLGSIEWLNNKGLELDIKEVCKNAQGIGLRWHDNGALWVEDNYVNGRLHGTCKCWHENGTLLIKEMWRDGMRHGITEFWLSDGRPFCVENWENGVLIK